MNSQLEVLDVSRALLTDAIEHLSDDQLRWKALDGAKSIGETLLHIASFEYLMSGSSMLKSNVTPNLELWDTLSGGFAREAGFSEPTELTLQQYKRLLSEVRAMTSEALKEDFTASDESIEKFIELLSQRDSDAPAETYPKLIRALKLSAMAHGAFTMSVPAALQSHESYHRGQVFFQRHMLPDR